LTILVVRGHARLAKQGYLVTVRTPVRDPETGKKTYQVAMRIPILDLEMVVIVGSQASISTGLLLALAKAGVPVLVHGLEAEAALLPPFLQAYAEARAAQHRVATSPTASLTIAKKLIEAKIRGLANLASYIEERMLDAKTDTAAQLRRQAAEAVKATKTHQELLVAEANLTKKAWNVIRKAIPAHYQFPGRIPRAKDPINSAISYTYAILYTLATHALTAAGLDPHIGLLHRHRPGAKSLAYDYTEQFKPLAIHAVVSAARRTRLETSQEGTLTAKSLEEVTKTLYSFLKRTPTGRTRTNRAYIYAKAWELRETILKQQKYKPYIYSPK